MPLSFFWKEVLFLKQNQEKNTIEIRKSTMTCVVCLCVVLAVGTGVGLFRNYQTQKTYGELSQLAAVVEDVYYEEVDTDAAMDGAKKGYVDGLDDPYSQYMTEEEFTSYQTSEAGQSVEIGITVSWNEEGTLQVESVKMDSSAEKAGILVEDQIIAVDGVDTATLGYADAVSAVQGEEGTDVTLTIQRDDTQFDLELTRESVEVITAQGQMLDGQIGYIRISAFKENTPEQFQEIFDQLISDGTVALVFDLRDNGGGQVSSLEAILDSLLPEGEIAIATYRDGSTKTLVESDAEECDLPMAVIVNENTASAAELFSASLHDFEKAEIVGTTTFGKGIMQVTQQLADGGALTLTTATYQTTRGEYYHGVGITPDVVVEAGETAVDYENPDASTDPQLEQALEILKAES